MVSPKIAVPVLLLASTLILPKHSYAWTSSACVKGNGSDQLLNKNGKRKYKIHIKKNDSDKIRRPDGTIYTNEEVLAAIHLAAGAWNEQANGGYYVFDGLTTRQSLPNTKSSCDTESIDYDLFVVGGITSDSSLSKQSYKCTNSSGYHHQNIFSIYNSTNSGFLPWASDSVGTNEYDFIHNIAHELGHGLGLGHPDGTNPALVSVMQVTLTGNSTTSAVGKNRQRDLYKWDIECIHQIAGVRSTSGVVRYTTNVSPDLSSPTIFSGSWLGHKGAPGITKNSTTGNFVFSLAALAGSTLYWNKAINYIGAVSLVSTITGSPLPVMTREEDSRSYIFLPTLYETDNYAPESKHYLFLYHSTNDYATHNAANAFECSSSNGFTCSNSKDIYTGHKITAAFDNYNNITLIGWLNQNRLNNSTTRELFITTKHSNTINHFRTHISTNIQSKVTPAITCNAYSAGMFGDFDCVVVYVSQSQYTNRIEYKRFYLQWNSSTFNYNIVWDTGGSYITTSSQANYSTSHSLTAWYKGGYFYVAFLDDSLTGDERVKVLTSPNAYDWSELGTFGTSIIGPSAIGYWTDLNALVTWH